ncbi:MAG: esterase-like activity of phytase family protein [Gammaproteobacteria bacterium]|nr:esterase-like activity of phytase family protein [Gammaproteobacteria bacterium]
MKGKIIGYAVLVFAFTALATATAVASGSAFTKKWQGGVAFSVVAPMEAARFSSIDSGAKTSTLMLSLGIGSGAFHSPQDSPNLFYAITDRGPSFSCRKSKKIIGIANFCGPSVDDGTLFAVPDYTPRIVKIALSDQLDATIVETIELKDRDGKPISGLPNPLRHMQNRPGYSNSGARLRYDANGVDSEALVRLKNGGFWISDEYAPSLIHVAQNGTILERVVPESVAADLQQANYPVRGGLPDIYKYRKDGQGIESIALSPDERALYFMMQRPLANPDNSTQRRSRHVRLMKYALNEEGSLGVPLGEYLYVLDTPQTFANLRRGEGDLKKGGYYPQRNVKVSEIVALAGDELLVLERVRDVSKLYRINLNSGDNILGTTLSRGAVSSRESEVGKTLEQLYDPAGRYAAPVVKVSLFNSMTDMPGNLVLPPKVEGMALLDKRHLLLIGDNDFGIGNVSGATNRQNTQAVIIDIGAQLAATAGKTARIKMVEIGSYESGIYNASAAEITAYDKQRREIYVVNAKSGKVDILDAADPEQLRYIGELNVAADSGVAGLGAVNSVSVHGGLLAAAAERGDGNGNDKQGLGIVAFYNLDDRSLIKTVNVGSLPDMVTFTPAGTKLLVANEGEPNDRYDVDPEGSISIIDIVAGVPADRAVTVGFGDFNRGASRAYELPNAVRIFGKNASVAQDLEPEYITVAADSKTAWVSLQENNALAEIDIDAARITKIVALGFKDHSLESHELDLSDRDNTDKLDGMLLRNGRAKINIRNWDNVWGMYQPDTIANYSVAGQHYVVTANEGDSRDYSGFSEEARLSDRVAAGERLDAQLAAQKSKQALGRLKFTTTLGARDGVRRQLYAFGARSFSIWDDAGGRVYDSGSDFEHITAGRLGRDFNANNNKAPDSAKNDRSASKGPEPEALALGRINGRTYAFIGLERVGGIMLYDITSPYAPQFIQYTNNRDFAKNPSKEAAGDSGPEGMTFVAAADSPTGKALLIVANEVSGSTTVYQVY